MNDCYRCSIEKDCHYPFKVTDCFNQRKFWSLKRREKYDAEQEAKKAGLNISSEEYSWITATAVKA